MTSSRLTLEDVRSMTEPALSVDQTAGFLGVDRRTATRAMDRGEIPFIKIGARRLVPRLQLLAMVDSYGRSDVG